MKEVDIIPYVFYQELSNLKHMELTATVWIDPVAIIQPWSDEENRLHVTIKPFQLMVNPIFKKYIFEKGHKVKKIIYILGNSCGLLFSAVQLFSY